MLAKRLPVPAYDHLLKLSHTFNLLDARGAVGVTGQCRGGRWAGRQQGGRARGGGASAEPACGHATAPSCAHGPGLSPRAPPPIPQSAQTALRRCAAWRAR